MNKNYVFAGIGVVGIAAVIIVLVMMNTHPSLAEIVENKDCQEFGKFDQRMDETYGYDVKKMKAELNISDELFSKARSLGIDCAFDAVKSMYGNDSSDEDNTKSNSDVIREAAVIIHKRDCKQFVEWYDDNTGYIGNLISYNTNKSDLDSYNKYCKDPNTVLNETGIDVEEKWTVKNHLNSGGLNYDKWDNQYRRNYLSEIEESLKNTKSDLEVISEAAEIIKKRDCKQFVEWFDSNIDHVDVLDSSSDKIDLKSFNLYCGYPHRVLDENGMDIEEKWRHYDKWDKK